MKCTRCKNEIHIHINRATATGVVTLHYCEFCGIYSVDEEGERCSCGISFRYFLETGKLGCAACYTTFQRELTELVQKYRTERVGSPVKRVERNRIAIARTEEIAEQLASIGENDEKEEGDHRTKTAPPAESDRAVFQSYRIRIARNHRGIPYLNRLTEAQIQTLQKMELGSGAIASQWQSKTEPPVRLYTGDEDHLRGEWIVPLGELRPDGEPFRIAIEEIEKQIEAVNRMYDWQFDPAFGYLTACPGNSGSGIRISFLLDLRAIVESGQWPRWKKEMKQSGLEVRGAGGEGSPESHLVSISNRYDVGGDLRDATQRILAILYRIEQTEQNLRSRLFV